ncbi:unnamed protein product [Mortierella alpina]
MGRFFCFFSCFETATALSNSTSPVPAVTQNNEPDSLVTFIDTSKKKMLGQRHIQQPSERWFDSEARDAKFNIMSPTGRIRPFRGIALPNNKIGGIPWERPNNPTMVNNVYSRDEREPLLGMGQALYGVHAPTDMDGISFVYTKGPAGQTPFPTLVAMSGYFPHQQPQQPLHTSSGMSPHSPDSADCASRSETQPTSETMMRTSKPRTCCQKTCATVATDESCCAPPSSRKHGYRRPRSDSRVLTLDQPQRWRRQSAHQR